MSIRVGINGFGRNGRNFYREVLDAGADIEVVGVNDLMGIGKLVHLLRHDSGLRRLGHPVTHDGDSITVGDNRFVVLAERDPGALPWGELAVDVVVESTGRFTDAESARRHLAAGAWKVVISAPAKGVDFTVVMGINDDGFDVATHSVISNASCTINCLAPMAKVLLDNFGVEQGDMTTTRACTNDQVTLDLPHPDLRRAAAANIIQAGAAGAISLVIPGLKGKLDGFAMRVPVITGSATNLVATVGRDVTREEVNEAFREAANGSLKGYLEYTEDPVVSTDIIGSPASCTLDGRLTMARGRQVKIAGWYDNEWGYSNRLVDCVRLVAGPVPDVAR
jgi:glyceraldehyde 3-phosphate dehydrogenase